MRFSALHGLMFTASYEPRIKMWSFDSSIECSYIGALSGHDSTVTAIELITETNFLFSSDDFGMLKCWNLATK